jgi:hypothetical protein
VVVVGGSVGGWVGGWVVVLVVVVVGVVVEVVAVLVAVMTITLCCESRTSPYLTTLHSSSDSRMTFVLLTTDTSVALHASAGAHAAANRSTPRWGCARSLPHHWIIHPVSSLGCAIEVVSGVPVDLCVRA